MNNEVIAAMRFKIPNIDRVGLVLDISRILADQQINILSMELKLHVVFLEIEPPAAAALETAIAALRNTPGILDVLPIDLMPHQAKAEELKAVLSSVSEGILAIDQDARITQYNPAAQAILRIPMAQAIGRCLIDVFPGDIALHNALRSGDTFNHREIVIDSTGGHALISGRPVIDQGGHTIGAVAILRNINDVRELVHQLTGQLALTFDEIIHASPVMDAVVRAAKLYARNDSTILLRGETGTGKELFARAIHSASPRHDKAFVPINCAAIPDTLLESELFGYEDGTFTGGAKGGKPGLFEFAAGGTVFLDEIGEISSHLQAKLLRVLQERKVRRLGGSREVEIDVRILAATNRNLEMMLAEGRFREDLYYRLNVIPLFIPPLRERSTDITLLANFFLQRLASKSQQPLAALSANALDKLTAYSWPGNIRELENILERAISLTPGSILLAEHILLHPQQPHIPAMPVHGPGRTLAEIIDAAEKEALEQLLPLARSSRRLGTMLGLSHTAVLKKLRKHGLTSRQ